MYSIRVHRRVRKCFSSVFLGGPLLLKQHITYLLNWADIHLFFFHGSSHHLPNNWLSFGKSVLAGTTTRFLWERRDLSVDLYFTSLWWRNGSTNFPFVQRNYAMEKTWAVSWEKSKGSSVCGFSFWPLKCLIYNIFSLFFQLPFSETYVTKILLR